MVIGNHDNVISYVKLGPKALDFLQGRIRVMAFICFHTCFSGRAIRDEIYGDYNIKVVFY